MSLARTLASALAARRNFGRSERSQTRGRHLPKAAASAAESCPDRGFTSRFVTASDGLRLHVRIYGASVAGELPVVCLPGLTRTAADFHVLAAALAANPVVARPVVALDYRGHGQSDYGNPGHYGLRADLVDLSTVLTALNIARAVFVGTSHGGVLAMMLTLLRPTAIAGVILNDIGPVIEPRALLQIKGHMETLPVPRDFADGAEILRRLFGARFPKLGSQDWIAFARRTWRKRGGALAVDYDPRMARRLDVSLAHATPTLWEEFDALAHVPLMVVRGANSTMLTARTLTAMLARRRELDIVVVPDQGHAPLLDTPRLMRRIAASLHRATFPTNKPVVVRAGGAASGTAFRVST